MVDQQRSPLYQLTPLIFMMKKATLFSLALLFCTHSFAAELGKVTPEQLLEMQKNSNAIVIDVRTPSEWQSTGLISDSYKVEAFDSTGNFDEKAWLSKVENIRKSPNQPIILVCRSGNRSGKVGEVLTQQLGMDNVYHLSSGIQSWFNSGHSLSPNCMTVSCK